MRHELQEIADAVVQHARDRGFVLSRFIQQELKKAGLPEERWGEVVVLAGAELRHRKGRYLHAGEPGERARREREQKRRVHRAVRQMVRDYRTAAHKAERREEKRHPFVQTVHVRSEDGREHTLLTRDVSINGIRLVGACRLLGQKIVVAIPGPDKVLLPGTQRPDTGWTFVVRVLWTCAVGDDLFENGGAFVEVQSVDG